MYLPRTISTIGASRAADRSLTLLLLSLLWLGVAEARTIVVEPFYGANTEFTSITDAVNAAAAGDVIEVRPGEYNETVTLKPGVTVRGTDPTKTIVTGDGMALFVRGGKDMVVEKIRFVGTSLERPAVWIGPSSIKLRECEFTGSAQNAVQVEGAGEQLFTGCKFFGAAGSGLYLSGEATPVLEQCVLFGNRKYGAETVGTSMGKFRGCKFIANRESGLRAAANSRPECSDSLFAFNALQGVSVVEEAAPFLAECLIVRNVGSGAICSGGKPIFRRCRVAENGRRGVEVRGGRATIREAVVHGHGVYQPGILVEDKAHADVVGSLIWHNEFSGVLVREAATVLLRECTVHGNLNEGIWLKEGGDGKVERTIFSQQRSSNFGFAVSVAGSGAVDLAENLYYQNAAGTVKGTGTAKSDRTGDPRYRNAEGGDFSLESGSAAGAFSGAGPIGCAAAIAVVADLNQVLNERFPGARMLGQLPAAVEAAPLTPEATEETTSAAPDADKKLAAQVPPPNIRLHFPTSFETKEERYLLTFEITDPLGMTFVQVSLNGEALSYIDPRVPGQAAKASMTVTKEEGGKVHVLKGAVRVKLVPGFNVLRVEAGNTASRRTEELKLLRVKP